MQHKRIETDEAEGSLDLSQARDWAAYAGRAVRRRWALALLAAALALALASAARGARSLAQPTTQHNPAGNAGAASGENS